MSRKEISENVKRKLYAESMGRCMNPHCQKELFRINGDIIEKAHIDPYCKTANNSFENLVVYVLIVILILTKMQRLLLKKY